MAKGGKRIRQLVAKIDRNANYPLSEAVRLVKENAVCKFDETVEVSANLGVDPRHADQMVRGTVTLPHGTGKRVRILVFAKGAKAAEAQEAGAEYVGAEDLVEKIQGGWLDFERVVACPDVMGLVGRLGKILGPRGLMPNPKLGTVTFDVTKIIKEIKAGQVTFRVDKYGIIHAGVGKASFAELALQENSKALVDQLIRMRPAAAKGTYLKKVTLCSSMGPGVKVDLQTI